MKKTIHSDKQAKFCELLYRARKAKGLTQAEVAKKLGVPQSWVAKIEIGERRLDVVEFDDLALVLGINVSRFFRELRKLSA